MSGLENSFDFGDEARRINREALHIAAGDMACPTCDKTGSVIYRFEGQPKERECYDCEGAGWMDRSLQNLYFGEGGVNDAQEDQDHYDREEAEREAEWAEEQGL